MIDFKHYKHLMGTPYKMGSSDCFGLIRELYKKAYGIILPNYARPRYFFDARINVYARIVAEPCFQERGLCPLDFKEGDILAFRVAGVELVNHVGVYLGNGMFLHQMFDSLPREENLDERWLRRLYAVQVHVDVPVVKNKLNILDVMPEYLKAEKYVEQ